MLTAEQKQRQSEAMRARWADPEFRRKQARARKVAMMRAKPQAVSLGSVEVSTDPFPMPELISVRMDDLTATHRFSSLVGAKDSQWFTKQVPVPVGYRIHAIILEPAK